MLQATIGPSADRAAGLDGVFIGTSPCAKILAHRRPIIALRADERVKYFLWDFFWEPSMPAVPGYTGRPGYFRAIY